MSCLARLCLLAGLVAGVACGDAARPPGATPAYVPELSGSGGVLVAAEEPVYVAAVFRPVDPRPADRALTLGWETGKCQFFHSMTVTERPDRVVITVLERLKPDSLCPDAGIQVRRTARLKAPLGTRAIYNGGAVPPVEVST